MAVSIINSSNNYKILVIDDEKNLCNMLCTYLKVNHENVDATYSATDAKDLISKNRYDVIVTDLRLGDGDGTEILKHSKEIDPYVEVIIITGYGTLESASETINLGATSFLNKPLKLEDFSYQVDRAINTRLFHLKSLNFIHNNENSDFKKSASHLGHLTTLYHFASRMMLTLKVTELMKIILREINENLSASYVVAGVNYLNYKEIFAMPHSGRISSETVVTNFIENWSDQFSPFSISDFKLRKNDALDINTFKGAEKDVVAKFDKTCYVQTLPLSVLGERLGFISLYLEDTEPLTNDNSQFFYVLTSLISSAVQNCYLNAQASEQAKTDGLTGVANHRMFQEMVDREIARVNRNNGKFSIVILDIDDFKNVNDTHGHLMGDTILIDLTKRVLSLIRKSDLLARYGGEEFILILNDTDSEGAEILAERIRLIIADTPFTSIVANISYTVSIGFSTYYKDMGITKGQLIDIADKALYQAKESGKNRVVHGKA